MRGVHNLTRLCYKKPALRTQSKFFIIIIDAETKFSIYKVAAGDNAYSYAKTKTLSTSPDNKENIGSLYNSSYKDPLYIETNLDISKIKVGNILINESNSNSSRHFSSQNTPEEKFNEPQSCKNLVKSSQRFHLASELGRRFSPKVTEMPPNYKKLVKKEMDIIRAIGPKAAKILREAKMARISSRQNNTNIKVTKEISKIEICGKNNKDNISDITIAYY